MANPKDGKTNTGDLFANSIFSQTARELNEFTHNCFSVFKLHLFIGNKQQYWVEKGPEIQYSNCWTLFHLLKVSTGSLIDCHKSYL